MEHVCYSLSFKLSPAFSLQLLSESQINMVKVVNSVSDALSSMQKETGNIKSRLKADLQRAPVHSVRPKGCAGGEGKKKKLLISHIFSSLQPALMSPRMVSHLFPHKLSSSVKETCHCLDSRCEMTDLKSEAFFSYSVP